MVNYLFYGDLEGLGYIYIYIYMCVCAFLPGKNICPWRHSNCWLPNSFILGGGTHSKFRNAGKMHFFSFARVECRFQMRILSFSPSIYIYIHTVRANHLEAIFEGAQTTPKILVLKGAASKKDAIVQGYQAKWCALLFLMFLQPCFQRICCFAWQA